jgi:hypothetical protein
LKKPINYFLNLFNFDIVINKKKRQHRAAVLILSIIILLLVFIWGYITVYKNSYNMMNSKPMVVFDVNKTNDGLSVTILNNTINFY